MQEDSEAQYQSESQWLPHIQNDQVLQFVQEEERYLGVLEEIDSQLVRNLQFENSSILGNAQVAVFLACCSHLKQFHLHFLNQLKKRLVQIEQKGKEAGMIQLEETLAVTSDLLSITRVVIVQLETRKDAICSALTKAVSQSLDDCVLDEFVASKDLCLEEFVCLPCRRFDEILQFVQRLCQHAKLKRLLQGVYAHEIDKTKEFVEKYVKQQASLQHLLALQPSLKSKEIDLFGKKLLIEGKLRLLSKLSCVTTMNDQAVQAVDDHDEYGAYGEVVALKVYLFDDGLLLFSHESLCKVEFFLRLKSVNVLVETVPSIVQTDNCLTNAFVLLHNFEKWMFGAEEAAFQRELMQQIERFQTNRDILGEINAQRQQATLVLPRVAIDFMHKAKTQTLRQHDVAYEDFNCVWVRRIWDLDLTVDLNTSTGSGFGAHDDDDHDDEDDEDEWKLMEAVLVDEGRAMVLLESQGWLGIKSTASALVVHLEKETRLECFGNRTGQSEWQLEISNPNDEHEQEQQQQQQDETGTSIRNTMRIRLVSKDETRITFWYQRLADAISGLRDQDHADKDRRKTEEDDVDENEKDLLDIEEESTELFEPRPPARARTLAKEEDPVAPPPPQQDPSTSTKPAKAFDQQQEKEMKQPSDAFVSVRKKRSIQLLSSTDGEDTTTTMGVQAQAQEPVSDALSTSAQASKRSKQQPTKASPTKASSAGAGAGADAKSKKAKASTTRGRSRAKPNASASESSPDAASPIQQIHAKSESATPTSTPPASTTTSITNFTPSQGSSGSNNSIQIMFTGLDPTPALKKQIKAIPGAKYVTDVEKATHLVVQSNQLKRTVKLLCGIAQCDHIVDEQWLENSAKAGFAVDEETFCLKDPVAEKKWNFDLHHVMYGISKPARQQLFGDLDVFVTPHKSLRPPFKELVKIIQSAGGTVTTKGKAMAHQVVISSVEALQVPTVRKSLGQASPERIYSSEFILGSILQQGIDWTQNQLSL